MTAPGAVCLCCSIFPHVQHGCTVKGAVSDYIVRRDDKLRGSAMGSLIDVFGSCNKPIGYSERALQIMIYSKLSSGCCVSNTLYSLCLTGDFVTRSASSHFPPCVCTRPPERGWCVFLLPLFFVPREHHFWCLFALLRLFLVAFLCINMYTTHRYGWQTGNETPRHATYCDDVAEPILKEFFFYILIRVQSLKSRLQLNHVPVHETHSAKVRKIPKTTKTPSSIAEPRSDSPTRARQAAK
jgi:hypothetical protein